MPEQNTAQIERALLAQLIHNPESARDLVASYPVADWSEPMRGHVELVHRLLDEDALSWDTFIRLNRDIDWATALLTEHEIPSDVGFWIREFRRAVVGERIIHHIQTSRDPDLAIIQEHLDTLITTGNVRGWDEVDTEQGERLLTGYSVLDTRLNLRRGWSWIIAGETSVGKSAFSQNIAIGLARQGRRVMFVNLEMTDAEVRDRLDMMEPVLGDFRRQFLFASRITNTGDIRAAVRRTQPDVVIVDYLQLLNEPGHGSRAHQVAAGSRNIKRLAKDEGILAIVLSSLRRREERKRAPILTDLKESGDIEYDADCVTFIHAPDGPGGSTRNIICAKQRGGPVSNWSAIFYASTLTFVEATMVGGGDRAGEAETVSRLSHVQGAAGGAAPGNVLRMGPMGEHGDHRGTGGAD